MTLDEKDLSRPKGTIARGLKPVIPTTLYPFAADRDLSICSGAGASPALWWSLGVPLRFASAAKGKGDQEAGDNADYEAQDQEHGKRQLGGEEENRGIHTLHVLQSDDQQQYNRNNCRDDLYSRHGVIPFPLTRLARWRPHHPRHS
jgi:hypothetical protein